MRLVSAARASAPALRAIQRAAAALREQVRDPDMCYVEASAAQQTEGRPQGKAHDVAVAAPEVGHRCQALVLDSVRARLVEGVASGYGGGDLFVRVAAHSDAGDGMVDEGAAATGSEDGDGGDDAVDAPTQAFEGGLGLGGVVGLAEESTAMSDDGIGAEDGRVGALGGDGAGFGDGQTAGDALRPTREIALVDIGFQNLEREAEMGQQATSAGGGRGEDQHGLGRTMTTESLTELCRKSDA